MTALTPSQIEQYAYNAGFRGDALKLAVAVALAESAGNPSAYNPELAAGTKAGSGSRGLWQIYGSAHPQYNNNAVYDPQANANAAYSVYKSAGESFRPWSTYLNGAAQQIAKSLNLPVITSTSTAASAVSAVSGGIASPSAVSLATNAQPMQNILSSGSSTNAIKETISSIFPPDTGLNISIGLAGGLLVVFGFIVLTKSL